MGLNYSGFIICESVAKPCLTVATPWTIALQAPLSMQFPRQEYWSRLPFPSPEDFFNPGIEPGSPVFSALQADYLLSELLLLSHFSCVRLCATPETAAHQAPPSMGFSRQEYWSGLPFPSPLLSELPGIICECVGCIEHSPNSYAAALTPSTLKYNHIYR